MTVYNLPNDITFTKTIIKQGQGLYAPNEGSKCKVIIKFSSDDYRLNENLYDDLLPLNEEIHINLGFYSTVISNYIHKCLITMKKNECAQLDFDYCSELNENQQIKILIHLISFERFPEIYSMSIDNLYTFALKHKENANKFFRKKNYFQAFKLYHRSLCYILNFINEQPTDEHNELLENFNQLILSVYSNISACQLIYGNNLNVIENCSSALEINPNYVKALYRRGHAYANLNDYELALKDLQLANKIQPNDKKIEELLKSTKQRLEQYNKMFFIWISFLVITNVICEDFYSFTVKDWQGNDVSLEQYRGKVSLVVNVASECSFTDSHYEALVGLQQKLNLANRNIFQVLTFPSNQFGHQEPNNDAFIQSWIKDTFEVNFPIFAKGAVIPDDEEELPDVWRFLIEQTEPPSWNFWKYLIDPYGQVIQAYPSKINIRQIYPDIKKLLVKHDLIDKTEL